MFHSKAETILAQWIKCNFQPRKPEDLETVKPFGKHPHSRHQVCEKSEKFKRKIASREIRKWQLNLF